MKLTLIAVFVGLSLIGAQAQTIYYATTTIQNITQGTVPFVSLQVGEELKLAFFLPNSTPPKTLTDLRLIRINSDGTIDLFTGTTPSISPTLIFNHPGNGMSGIPFSFSGNVTSLTFTTVAAAPEPAAWILTFVGVTAFGFLRFRLGSRDDLARIVK